MSEVQSLYINYAPEKKEEETFESKMDFLFNQLDEQFKKVKQYANFDIPLDQVELNQYKFKYDFQNNNEINMDKENLIEFNNENKDNNDNTDEIVLKNKKVEINEIKDDEEIKKKMYDEIAYKRMEEERKMKELEIEKKIEKNLEEEKRIKEEQKKREEALIQKEQEILKREQDLIKKEKDLEKKREEEEKRKIEEKRKKEEEEEAKERERMLIEEEKKLKKEEEEKEKEMQRESARIKMLRMQKEKEEEEERQRKKIELEKKKEMEIKKKEQEIQEEQKLIDQIKNNTINNNNKTKKSVEENSNEINEIDIEEINTDEDIEELEAIDTNKQSSNNNKNTVKSNIKSINSELNSNTKLKSVNKPNLTNSRFNNKSINNFNNKSRNKFTSPTKKSQIKESTNKSMKKPKNEKKPEDSLFKEKQDKNRDESEFVQKFKKSDVYSKISQEIIDKLLEHIYAIDDFDEESENDDINIYPSITQFNKDDKNLKEMIPDFEEKILKKEKLKVDDRYRKYYSEEEAFDKNQENDKVNELLIEIMNISNESHMEILQKNFEKEKLKNLPTTEFDDLNDIEELENKLFGKEDFYPNSFPIVSNLQNLRTFIYKFESTAKENPKIMVNAIQSFNYWRSVINDGNSFYRVIMYSLLEHCILNKDEQFLMFLLNEISSDDFIEYYKKRKIEYNKPFIILSAINIMLGNKLEVKALEYLLKAYNLKNGCFDMLLIIYLKKVLADFAKEINKLLDEKKKSEENLDLIEETKINVDQIEELYLDPPKMNMFNLISELFNINIQLFLLGGRYLEPINSLTNIDKDDSSATFIFGYFFSGYHVLYNPNFDENNEVFKNIAENDNPQLCRLTTELKENKKCDICFKETQHIAFLQKQFIVCFPCLTNFLKESIKKRSDYFFDDQCLGQEYYSRPIHLQEGFYLDDFDFEELSEEGNIINNLYSNNKESNCVMCDKMKSEDVKLLTFPCKCCICEECFNTIFNRLTDNKGYLLECEVEMNNQKLQCNCGKMYDYNDIKYLSKPTKEQIEKAKERLSLYKDNYCLICLSNLIKEDDVKKVKIKKERDDDKEHFICLKCYCKYFKNLDFDSDDEDITKEENEEKETKDKNEKDKEIKVIKDEHKIKCSICRRWHHFVGSVDGCGCALF